MKKLTAGIFTVMLGLVVVDATAAITSKKYVDDALLLKADTSALNAVKEKADGAVQTTDFNTFKTQNTAAIATAKSEAIDAAKSYADTELGKKQDKLTAGTNISIDAATNRISATGFAAATDLTNLENRVGTAESDISALKNTVAGKQDVSNMATGEYESGSTMQYPSIKVAESIAKTAADASMQGIGDLGRKDYVETDDIVDSAVTSDKIANGTITTADISATAGITKEQLATAVQTSLGKADSALQSVPVATTDAPGGVRSGGSIAVGTDGIVTVNQALRATQDGKGSVIADTYATKAQLNALDSTSTGTGAVVTAVSQTDGKVSVTKGNVQIPVGSASGTTYATIWVE